MDLKHAITGCCYLTWICLGLIDLNLPNLYSPQKWVPSWWFRHAAMLRLGGQVINIHEDKSSSLHGERFEDTIRTLCSYGGVLVMRHSDPEAIEIAKKVANKPIVHAGKYIHSFSLC